MALGKCKECSKEVSTEASVCPHCGKKEPTGRHTSRTTWGCLAIIVLAVVGSMMQSSADQQNPTNSAVAMPKSDTMIFLSAAVSYLMETHQQGTELAHTMAGINDGSSTLGDIKDALSRARFLNDAGYEGDYRAKINGRVPAAFRDDAERVDETHRLFNAALTECLEYWKDQNLAHAESGMNTLKRAIVTMSAEVDSLNLKMRRIPVPAGKIPAARTKM